MLLSSGALALPKSMSAHQQVHTGGETIGIYVHWDPLSQTQGQANAPPTGVTSPNRSASSWAG
eukprot:3991045-Amphidinium_carterae.1